MCCFDGISSIGMLHCQLPQSMNYKLHDALQVRQHTGHKRTFFYLEQLILKFSADQQCINIKEMHEVGKHPQTDIPG